MTITETRLDRAPWRPLHTRIQLGLGIGWALDSFEVQIIGSVLTPLGSRARASGLEAADPDSRGSVLSRGAQRAQRRRRGGAGRLLRPRAAVTATATAAAPMNRNFPSLAAVAEEAGLSRIWAGQHTRLDHDAGQQLGRQVAAQVLAVLPAALNAR